MRGRTVAGARRHPGVTARAGLWSWERPRSSGSYTLLHHLGLSVRVRLRALNRAVASSVQAAIAGPTLRSVSSGVVRVARCRSDVVVSMIFVSLTEK